MAFIINCSDYREVALDYPISPAVQSVAKPLAARGPGGLGRPHEQPHTS